MLVSPRILALLFTALFAGCIPFTPVLLIPHFATREPEVYGTVTRSGAPIPRVIVRRTGGAEGACGESDEEVISEADGSFRFRPQTELRTLFVAAPAESTWCETICFALPDQTMSVWQGCFPGGASFPSPLTVRCDLDNVDCVCNAAIAE